MQKQCLQCQKEYRKIPCLINKSRFCCRDCKIKYYTGKHLSPKTQFKKGLIPWNKGKKNPYTSETIKRMALSQLGKKRGNPTIQARINHSLGAKRGKESNLWRGGITKPNEALRKSLEYRLWRTAVYERDNYTCVIGGKAHGDELNADHIKSYALYPELRFELSNGQTLCIDCHAIKTKRDMVYITTEVRRQYAF